VRTRRPQQRYPDRRSLTTPLAVRTNTAPTSVAALFESGFAGLSPGRAQAGIQASEHRGDLLDGVLALGVQLGEAG
jgi:hypothetical protein